MGILKEFKEFAMRGNVIDLAVGVIIGAAFGKIVSSLVADIIMPPIGMAMNSVNFNDLFIVLDPKKAAGITSLAKAKEAGVPVIAYGSFLTSILDFVIVAFCVFLLVKGMNALNRAKAQVPPEAPTTKDCPFCFSTILVKATRCPQCTSELPAQPIASPTP